MSVFICRLSTQICLLLLKPRDVKLHSSLKRLNVILKSHTKKKGMRLFQYIKQPSDTILWSLNGTVLFLKTRAPPH